MTVSPTKVCHQIRAVINNSIALQYELELCAAGMVDTSCTPSLPISKRLERLRAYENAWLSAPFSFHPLLRAAVNDPDHSEDWWMTTGGTIPYTRKGALRLFRPASVIRGVPEKTWSFPSPVVELGEVAELCVDFQQDLLVFSKWSENQDGR